MTLKDDIEIMRALVRDSLPDMPPGLCRTACARAAAAKRVIALAERAANPALPALLEACEAARLRNDDGAVYLEMRSILAIAQAIDRWRAAKAEGFEAPARDEISALSHPDAGGEYVCLVGDWRGRAYESAAVRRCGPAPWVNACNAPAWPFETIAGHE